MKYSKAHKEIKKLIKRKFSYRFIATYLVSEGVLKSATAEGIRSYAKRVNLI